VREAKKRFISLGITCLILGMFLSRDAFAIPSYARQTNLSCSVCHIIFPRLNSFGRLFKLNGYTMTGIRSIVSTGGNNPSLKLTSFMPMSAMVQVSQSSVRRALPEAKRAAIEFPQQLSFFIAGEITPNLGTFVQITYDDQSARFGWDNTDIRFALARNIGSKRAILGLTLNNGPTVQDVWNSTPAWGFPFAASGWARTPQAGTLIEGALNGQVARLGACIFYDNLAHAEFSAYASTPQGGPFPAGEDSVGEIRGVSPYWRLALQHAWGEGQYLSVGTYGLSSRLHPQGIEGPTDNFTDLALDAQFERTIGDGGVQLYATWISERRNLLASTLAGAAASPAGRLRTFKGNVSYQFRHTYVFTLAYSDVSGSGDALLYLPGPVYGFRTAGPASSSFILEATLYAWQNMMLTLQYRLYSRFNGAASDYDGFGRSASDNNTLYLLLWIAF
jgi:hypothetical protein